MARKRDQPERREHGGQREQQRDAGRHERAEREHEDEQRDRKRERARLAEVVAVTRFDALLRAGVAELADREAAGGPPARLRPRRGPAATLSTALSLSPLIVKSTSAAWPSFATAPRWTPCTAATRETRATTSVTAASKAGVPARAERLRIRTLSSAGCLKPSSRILSMRPDSPGPGALGSALLTPIAVPRPKRRSRTRASRRSPSSSARRSSDPCGRRGWNGDAGVASAYLLGISQP